MQRQDFEMRLESAVNLLMQHQCNGGALNEASENKLNIAHLTFRNGGHLVGSLLNLFVKCTIFHLFIMNSYLN